MQEIQVRSLGWEEPPRKEMTAPSSVLAWDLSLGWEDSPGEGKGYPLRYSGLENSIDCIVYGVAKSWTRLSDFHFHFSGYDKYRILSRYLFYTCMSHDFYLYKKMCPSELVY